MAISNCFIAPGTYDVEKAEKVTQQSTGAVVFGIKYKDPKPDDIPGMCLGLSHNY